MWVGFVMIYKIQVMICKIKSNKNQDVDWSRPNKQMLKCYYKH